MRRRPATARALPCHDGSMSSTPSVSYSITVRLEVPAGGAAVSQLTSGRGRRRGRHRAGRHGVRRTTGCASTSPAPPRDTDHADEIVDGAARHRGRRRCTRSPTGPSSCTSAARSRWRPSTRSATVTTCRWSTRPAWRGCALAIAENPDDARRLTVKRNSVAVVTDGSAVLGLGNIGPARRAAGDGGQGRAVQAVRRHRRVAAVPGHPGRRRDRARPSRSIAPGFAGINLEDISAPRCFEIEARLRELLDIPVFHDDQHGTAIVVLAALTTRCGSWARTSPTYAS